MSIGLATALVLMIKKLQRRKNDYAIVQERLKEADKRLQEADQKYGGLISREDTVRELNTKITVLKDQLNQLDKQAQVEEQKSNTSKNEG
jgi:cellobiose-specific phosphotransferase system component IIA